MARYRLPEPLREYGQQRMHQSGAYTALRRRHRDWHEQPARRVDTDWLRYEPGFTSRAQVAAWVTASQPTVKAAQPLPCVQTPAASASP